MNYFLVTTSIFNDSQVRKLEYISGISQLLSAIIQNELTNYKVIIIENNGYDKKTFLDELLPLLPNSVEIFHTNNNNVIHTNNKGRKELQDVLDCIKHFNITDDDFVVKVTGRYLVMETSIFFTALKLQYYDCIVRYGSYMKPLNYKMKDCITGFVGMKCKYIKQITMPNENECVEWKWAEATLRIDESKIFIPDKLNMIMKSCCDNTVFFL
jgi:hypothetical protein